MGMLSRLLGTESRDDAAARRAPPPSQNTYALERYRYMLQTAPPETIEQAHAEAFAQLTPEQRRQVLAELVRAAPRRERPTVAQTSPDDPQALARAATRAEVRQPGIMERTLGASPGMASGAGLLGTFAAAFTGSLIASSFFASLGGEPGGAGAADDGGSLDGLAPEDTDLDATYDFDGGDFDL